MNDTLSVSNEMRVKMNENPIVNSFSLSSVNFNKSCKHKRQCNHHMNDFLRIQNDERNMKIRNE